VPVVPVARGLAVLPVLRGQQLLEELFMQGVSLVIIQERPFLMFIQL
jgi:hypothetical protein